jgi:transposase
MSDLERAELLKLRAEHQEVLAENRRLTKLLQESLNGNKQLQKQLAELQEKLDILIVQFNKRNRRDFGSKTERHNPRPAIETAGLKTTKIDKLPATPPTSSKHEKHILRHNLPTREVIHKVTPQEAICPHCSIDTVFVRDEISHQLERLQYSLERLQHLQEVRACPKCKQYIVTASKPCPPIPGSYAGPGLLADIVVNKLADGLPNHRQERRFSREEAIIPRSTQCDWMLTASLTVQPLWELLKSKILESHIIQTDESELKVQDRMLKGKMRKGKMTVYRGDRRRPYTVFDFSPNQSFVRNLQFLKDFKGIVQADAANGFDALFKDGTKAEAGCSAHSRRRYFDCLVVEPVMANNVLKIYGNLYEIERKTKDATPAVRLAMRRRFSKPLVKRLRKLIVNMRSPLTPKHPLTAAIDYTLNHWLALTRFLKNPEIEIDNNASEREIKSFVLDRKNFLFAGSDAGGKAIAILLSLIASANRNDIDPRKYLTDIFTRINSMKTSELHELLPDRWKQKQANTS